MEQRFLAESLKDRWDLLSKKKKVLIVSLVFLFLFLFLSLFWNQAAPENLVQAKEAYRSWKNHPGIEESLALKSSLELAPSLKRRFSAELAQLFLIEGDVKSAEQAIKPSLKILQQISPDHAEFSMISILIKQGKLQEALDRSLDLKEVVQDKQSLLYARNLLRISFLSGCWQEWQVFEKNHYQQARKALQGFENQISFQSYLDALK